MEDVSINTEKLAFLHLTKNHTTAGHGGLS